ncbi:hypothetical protein PAXRUDRAFT_168951, partial [Paxillus rubicundulus Ve08.2h10]
PISWLLSMQVTCNHISHTLSTFQKPFVEAILAKFNFTNLNPVSIPMDPNIQCSETQSLKSAIEIAKMCQVPFFTALGLLMYLAISRRPDIAWNVGQSNQRNREQVRRSQSESEWNESEGGVIRYVKCPSKYKG